jgi:hypothetical protein
MSDYDMPADTDNAKPETKCKHTSAYRIGEGWNTNADNTVTLIRHYGCDECNTVWVETELYLGNGRNAPDK